ESYVTTSLEQIINACFSQNPVYHALLAKIDGAVVGYTSYLVQFDSWSGQSYLNLDDLFVQEEARGKGVGPQLMQTVAQVAL
ncbi:MAG: GNAT family N-acetyltransferase, partial [Chloroflexales bacterium]|nr:GNAT family N-acetyltransferase [Chloroflexales bacterium]